MRDMIHNKQVVVLGNITLSGTTPVASDWVDVRDFDAVTLIAQSNTITDAGTASGYTLTLQDGDDTTAAGAADVAALSAVDGVVTLTETVDANDNTLMGGVGYVGGKRYVRFNAVGTTGTAADVTVFAVLNKPHRAKTTFVGTSVAAT